jgi:hypothetical protein
MFKLILVLFIFFIKNVWAVSENLATQTTNALGSTSVHSYYSQGLAKKKRCFLLNANPTVSTCFGSSSVGNSAKSDKIIEIEISGITSKVCCEDI